MSSLTRLNVVTRAVQRSGDERVAELISRQYDPINGVWMRVMPNLGMSFAELEAEMDRMVAEQIMRGPLLEEMVREKLRQRGVLP